MHISVKIKIFVLEIASNSHGKRNIRCCGKNVFPSIFKKLSRRSSKTTPVKHANVVLLSETANRSPSNWLSGTKPSKVSLLNNFYVDPYEPVRAEKPRLSGLIDSLLDVSENAYAKWEQGTDLFMVENSHPSPPSSVKAKRRRQQVNKSNQFRRVASVAYAPNDPYYLIALELSKLISSATLKYHNDCYTESRRQYQPECVGYQYDVPATVHWWIQSRLNIKVKNSYLRTRKSRKIQNFKIFLSLEKVDHIPGYSQLV